MDPIDIYPVLLNMDLLNLHQKRAECKRLTGKK